MNDYDRNRHIAETLTEETTVPASHSDEQVGYSVPEVLAWYEKHVEDFSRISVTSSDEIVDGLQVILVALIEQKENPLAREASSGALLGYLEGLREFLNTQDDAYKPLWEMVKKAILVNLRGILDEMKENAAGEASKRQS